MHGAGCVHLIFGTDQVIDAFRLRKVHLPIEEGPFRKFAAACHPDPGSQNKRENAARNIDAAMAADFDTVFARITFRSTVDGKQNIINRLTGIVNGPVVKRISLRLRKVDAGDFVNIGDRIRTADADYGDCRIHRRRRNGRNGICHITFRSRYGQSCRRLPG